MTSAKTIAALCLSLTFTSLGAAPYESPPTFKASSLIPKEALKSDIHQVREAVPVVSALYHFSIDSDFGVFEALGTDSLYERVREIHALAELGKIEKGKGLINGVGDEGGEQIGVVGSLVKSPVKTVVAVPKGAFRILRRVGSATGQLNDKSQPHSNPLRIYLGTDSEQHELAGKLGVNPYTDNAQLQKEMNRVARSTSVTGAAIRFFAPWSLGISLANEQLITSQLKDLYMIPSTDLFAENKKTLQKMGVNKQLIDKFLKCPAFDPVQETVLVRALNDMTITHGLETFLELACQSGDRIDAYSFRRTARLMSVHERTKGKQIEIHEVAGYPVLIAAENRHMVVPVYCDYAIWSEHGEALTNAFVEAGKNELQANQYTLLLTGTLSDHARSEIQSRGFQVIEYAFRPD